VRRWQGGLEGGGKRFAVVVARFNSDITARLASGAVDALLAHGVAAGDIEMIHVPGAWELPAACARVIERGDVDGVVALGCVIRGETAHFEYVAGESARGLATVQRESNVPVAFGVLTTENVEQALARSEKGPENKGSEAALAALEMANLFDDLS
jgi:6,7-dimethyl-8-ribityllumazine synthase